MDTGVRLREPTQQRKRARDQKLLERELEYAAAQGWHFCPCTLCLRENRSGLIPRSYSRCVRRNSRCPWFRGSSQGFDHDEFDDEWDEHIRWKYGAQAFEAPPLQRLDTGMDLVDMAIESLDIADGIRVASTTERDLRENPPQPEQGGGDVEALRREEGNYDPAEGCSEPREDSSSDDEYLDWGELEEENEADIEVLEEAAATPLFAHSEHSCMGAIYILLSSARLYKCPNAYIDELFRTLSTSILPT